MPDALTRLINNPPDQLVSGGVLAGIVWRFFERVEAVLTCGCAGDGECWAAKIVSRVLG